jgi:TonB-linked SusC/RagA family outer membrane protein
MPKTTKNLIMKTQVYARMKRVRIMKAGWLILAFLGYMPLMAQKGSAVIGTVINEKNEGVAGVTVTVRNESGKENYSGTTDDQGGFSFRTLTAGEKYEFTTSHVAYESNVVKNYLIRKNENNSLLIKLKLKDASLDAVIVTTALGIKRQEKSLGYATQTLGETGVTDAKTNNWVNSLSGKVAGLNIQGSGSGPMGSSRITLRGENSLNLDNNQALVVLDGVPISNKITGTGYSSYGSTDNAVDYGSDISDINPDDISSITVLKGPGATALYGNRAAGGALIITTKTGARKDKGIGVSFSSNVSIDQVNRWPDYQYEYGEGRTMDYYSYGNTADGINTSTTASAGRAWGPKFNGQSYFQYDPNTPDHIATTRTPWVAYPNYIKGFFRTGSTFTNTVSLEGGNEKSSARLSISEMKNNWIVPNTGFERLSVALSVNQKISDRLKITGKVNYTNKTSDNLPTAGYNNQTIMYFMILGTMPNVNPKWFQPYWLPGLKDVQQASPFNPGPGNVNIDIYENLSKLNKNGVIGNVTASYTINDKTELMIRTGLDMAFEFHSQQRPYSQTKFPKGSYREQSIFNYEMNTDALLTYKDKLGSAFKYTVSAGANTMAQAYNFAGMYADQLSQPGIYQISNSLNQAVADPQRTKKAINSVYAFSQWSYLEKIFLDITGRNDWSSTLPYKHNSFFYPSVSSSFILSDLFHLPRQLSFAKLRLSWAQVGNDTRPYQTAKYYNSIYGNSFTNPTTLFNPELKPEISSSFEEGLELRLFNSRLYLDGSVYQNNSRNQIIAIPLDQTSGYSSALINAGLIESRGVELQVKGIAISSRNFRWTTTLNWSTNRSYVKELANGVNNQVIFSHESTTIEARVGGRMGDMYGKGFARTPDGQMIYNSTGLPVTLDQNLKVWGNAFPDWKAGLMNEFNIKNFRVSILFDYQHGGNMYSQSNHKYNTLGKTRVTLPGRDEGIVGKGVVMGSDGKYTPNTVRVSAESYYETYYAIDNSETNVFDATYLKLREVRIEFSLGKNILKKVGVQQTSIAIYGRDLFNITKFPAFDPEGGNLNDGTLTPGVEIAQYPSTRNMGINLMFKF